MRPPRRIPHRPAPHLLDRLIRECLPAAVLREPDRLRRPVDEADHVVFPVADVVSQRAPQDGGAAVEGVEVGVEDVEDSGGAADGDDGCGGGGGEAGGGGFGAGEVGGGGGDVSEGGEVDVEPAGGADGVEEGEVGEGEGCVGGDGGVVDGGVGVLDVGEEGGGEVFFVLVKPDEGCWEGG
ncbi:hypothetical protein V500_01634 [Pseudogymnoascus sp. VKM F-4518 (FW-2643)]|nr:hypothetical protein V500_01634 [Pseudogymnoascus sp. VKM F-4518 (FW-2643)]